jgi:hypothetical protein
MVEIEFSVMEFSARDSKKLLPLLDAFEKEHYIHVNLVGIPSDNGWAEIAKFGIYGNGPDVSSIGSSWIASLAAMFANPDTDLDVILHKHLDPLAQRLNVVLGN